MHEIHDTVLHGFGELGTVGNIGYPLKSRENLFIHNSHVKCKVVLKFCTEHGSINVVFSAKFENDWPSDRYHGYVIKQKTLET